MTLPTAAILALGEEILQGRILDTNSQEIAQHLLRSGVWVRRKCTLGDQHGALREILPDLAARHSVIVSTGGLGPTVDDRVRQDIADYLRVPLVEVPGALEPLGKLWRRQHNNEAPPEYYLNQGRVPQGALALPNRSGTAWGFACDLSGGARIYCLPGPPAEVRAAFLDGGGLEDIKARFAPKLGLSLGTFHLTGATEAQVEKRIRDLLEIADNPQVGITANARRITVSVLAQATTEGKTAEELIAETEVELRRRLGPWLWGRDDDSLESVVVDELRRRALKLTIAESCTGGQLSAALTAVPGASQVYEYGWMTYANKAKIEELNVPEALLIEHGAVSAPVAQAMAVGARLRSGADWALATTGIAGPGGGTEQKPVGLVYIGVAGPAESYAIRRRQFARAGRQAIQEQSVRDALEALRRELLAMERLPEKA